LRFFLFGKQRSLLNQRASRPSAKVMPTNCAEITHDPRHMMRHIPLSPHRRSAACRLSMGHSPNLVVSVRESLARILPTCKRPLADVFHCIALFSRRPPSDDNDGCSGGVRRWRIGTTPPLLRGNLISPQSARSRQSLLVSGGMSIPSGRRGISSHSLRGNEILPAHSLQIVVGKAELGRQFGSIVPHFQVRRKARLLTHATPPTRRAPREVHKP